MLKNLKRRLARLEKQRDEMESRHKGNEQNFTYHGGFDLGYIKGKIAELENFIDDLSQWDLSKPIKLKE